jgi:hypothetical protein
MESNLRPLSLGEILDRTAQLYRSNFLLFYGIASVYAGVLLVLGLIEIGAEELLRAMHLASKITLLNGIFILVIYIVLFLVGGIAIAATTRAVAWLNLGEPATIRGAYASVLPRFGRYLWLQFLKALFAWGPFIVIYVLLVGGLLYVTLSPAMRTISNSFGSDAPAQSGSGAAALVILVVGFVGFALLFLALIYAIFMALRYALAVPACVVENLAAQKAIKRSIELSKESRGRIFVLWLLVFVLQAGLVLVSQIFFIWAAYKNHFVLPPGLRALQQIISFFTDAFVFPILATGITLFYYDQRIRKEGYDIEWMMQAAGLTAPAALALEAEPRALEADFTAQANQQFATGTLLVEPAPAQDAVTEPTPPSGSAHE